MSLAVLALLFVPVSVLAEDPMLSRRDGFLLIWQSINRPATEVNIQPFADVLEGERGYTEITFAKRRGILEDAASFHPDTLMTMEDALIWVFRTRNVGDLDDMERQDIDALLERYPIAIADEDRSGAFGSTTDLLQLMARLDRMLRDEVHEVSFYAEDFHGKGTAFGETFDMHDITAAHRTFPHNTLVKVTNLENDKTVTVRINDRGPYIEGRSMDLSLASFEAISPRSRGVLNARFERLGDQTLVDECSAQVLKFQKRITRDVRFNRGVPHSWTLGKTLTLASTRPFIVRSITYPDGFKHRMQRWVYKDREKFQFTPEVSGLYLLHVGTGFGRSREMRMEVESC